MDSFLERYYYDPASAGSFSGPDALYRGIASSTDRKVSKARIRKWLKTQPSYTLHRTVLKNFRRRKIVTQGLDYLHELDLMDVQKYSKANDGVRYLLVSIDTHSRFVRAQPLKSKQARPVLAAFNLMYGLDPPILPQRVRTDAGSEFVNRTFDGYLAEREILHSIARNPFHAGMVERCIRTLKNKITKYMQKYNTQRYVDKLQDFVDSQNRSHHRVIGMTPLSARDKGKEGEIWEDARMGLVKKAIASIKAEAAKAKKTEKKPGKRKRKKRFQTHKYKFKLGASVRIARLMPNFSKDYSEKWSTELFKIATRSVLDGVELYVLEDANGEKIVGQFYPQEIQEVTPDPDPLYRVERVLRSTGRGRLRRHFVKWEGYPSEQNSWILDSELVNLT